MESSDERIGLLPLICIPALHFLPFILIGIWGLSLDMPVAEPKSDNGSGHWHNSHEQADGFICFPTKE